MQESEERGPAAGTGPGAEADDDEDDTRHLATRAFAALGTMVSVSAPMAADELDAAVETARRVFRLAEEDFGGGQGLAGRLRDGTMELRHSPRRARPLFEQAIRWRSALGGSLAPQATDGPVDVGPLVKGWAIAHTGQAMMDLELPHWAITAGGDVLCSGSPFPAQPTSVDAFYGTSWRAGITGPQDPTMLLADVPLAGTPGYTAALATSARPGTQPGAGNAGCFRQVSVLAEDILSADVLAQAILAGGNAALDAAVRDFGVDVLVLAPDTEGGDDLYSTAGWPLQAT